MSSTCFVVLPKGILEENIEPLKKWEDFKKSLFEEYNDYEFAILDVHS